MAKYGLAAHLAMLAVAPLFLFPFFGDATIATSVLWLSAMAALWVMVSPSVHSGEMPHQARARSWRHILRDPLLWIMLTLVVVAGLRALNAGVARAYNAEQSHWFISSAEFAWFPGSVGTAGRLPFAACVSFLVVVMGVRHALGSAARMAFLFLASLLSGLSAVIALFAAHGGCEVVNRAMIGGIVSDHLVGTAFAVGLLAGIVALVAALERKWTGIIPLFAFAIGGNVAGSIVFLSPLVACCFLLPLVLIIAYAFWYLHATGAADGEYKLLALVATFATIGGLLVFVMVPSEVVSARFGGFAISKLMPADYVAARSALSAAALRAWQSHSWLGLGCGSTPLAIEFFVDNGDWASLPAKVTSIPNGWWRNLVEGGIAGTAMQLLPLGALVFVFVNRLRALVGIRRLPHPSCWLFPLALASLVAAAFFDISPFRAEVVVLFGALCALSVNSVSADSR